LPISVSKLELVDDVVASSPDYRNLDDSFKTYKQFNVVPSVFGKDDVYTQPAEAVDAELWHIHLKTPTRYIPSNIHLRFTSDTHLVYTRGKKDRDHYLLVAILTPDAHDQANDDSVMMYLASLASEWRKSH